MRRWGTRRAPFAGSPPTAPTSLTATVTSSTSIHLAWVDNSFNETSFRIERGTDGVVFAEIASVGPGVTTYDDTGLTAGTLYYYRVRARNGAINSPYTNVASATTWEQEVQDYIDTYGITDTTEINATNTFIVGLKANSFFTRFECMYLFSPTSAAAALGDFFLLFPATAVNSPTFSTSGYTTNGTSSYINTTFIPNLGVKIAGNDFAYFEYLRSATAGANKYYMGANGNLGARPTHFRASAITDAFYTPGNLLSTCEGNPVSLAGLWTGVTFSGTDASFYKNASLVNQNTTSATKSKVQVNMYMGCNNNNGTANNFGAMQVCFFAISTKFTAPEVSTFYTLLQTFQTNVVSGGRQV